MSTDEYRGRRRAASTPVDAPSTVHFNPPPNWPALPADFTPSPGWQPDPAWTPVPYGWSLWIDDAGAPVDSSSVPRPGWARRHYGVLLLVGVGVVVLVIGLAVQSHNKHAAKLAGHQVTYNVTTGSGGDALNIDYSTAGGSQQAANVATPWTYSAGLRALGAQAALVLTAQNGLENTGSITCTITVDGAVAASNTSTGAAAVVICTALIH